MKSWILILGTSVHFILVLSAADSSVPEANAADVGPTTGNGTEADLASGRNFAAGNLSTGPAIWNETSHIPNNLTLGSDCSIVSDKVDRKNQSIVITTDNCTDELARKFMHCNPVKKICECYRDWVFESPNYTDPNFSEIPEWFVYDEEAGECVVKAGMRCGSVTGNSPYLCEGEGRCVKMKKKDPFSLFCEGAAEPTSRLSTGLIVIVTSYFVSQDILICI